MNTEKPVFVQIGDMIEDDILNGTYKPDDIIISTTQISKLLQVNPTTAVKAVSILADRGILYKKRGIGMAVTQAAQQIILSQRKQTFYQTALPEFIAYAEKIGISRQILADILGSDGEPSAFAKENEDD